MISLLVLRNIVKHAERKNSRCPISNLRQKIILKITYLEKQMKPSQEVIGVCETMGPAQVGP